MNAKKYSKYLLSILFFFTPFVVYSQKDFQNEINDFSNAYSVTMTELAENYPDLWNEIMRVNSRYDTAKQKNDDAGYEQSMKALNKVLEKAPNNFYVAYIRFNKAYNWGKEFKDIDKLNEAEIYLKKLDKLSPNGWVIMYWRSDILDEIAVLDNKPALLSESIDILYDICDQFPTDIELKNTLGANFTKLGVLENKLPDYKDEILDIFMQCETIKKHSGSYNISYLYSLLNDKENAFKWLEVALKSEEKESIDREYFLKDADFKNLRTDERFLQLINKYRPK